MADGNANTLTFNKRGTLHKISGKQKEATCIQCGSSFLYVYFTGPGTLVCSDACRAARSLEQQKRRIRARLGADESGRVRKTCKTCGSDFEVDIRRGTSGKAYCGSHCEATARASWAKARPLCIVEGCKNPRAYKNGICNACYCRVRRTGTLDRRVYAYRAMHSQGYIRVKVAGHAMADEFGYVLEHRKVLYDELGPSDRPCHWCGETVYWQRGSLHKGKSRYRLVVDHLDGDKGNNSLSNLVPVCNACNAKRGLFMKWVEQHKDDPVLWSMYQSARSVA